MKNLFHFIFLCSTIGFAAGGPPNVLFIAIDDLRPELGCYGSTQAKTPCIDRLASTAVVFSRAYCQVPVCGASRASLMTGILPTRNRFVGFSAKAEEDAPGVMTLPETFRKAGYTTLSIGKIFHHKEDTEEKSWSKAAWRPREDRNGDAPEIKSTTSEARRKKPICEFPDVPDNAFPDGQIAAKTIEELRRLKQAGTPFFIACGLMKPHMPFQAPKRYWDLFDHDKIAIAENRDRPKNAPKQLVGSNEFRTYELGELPEESEEFHRMMRHGYLACTSYADKLTGDILNELESLGIAGNTIVVLWGDHGWHLGEHNFWGKHNTMHLSTRVPLIIRVPGKNAGVSPSLVETLDVFPTLCALAGVQAPHHVQGRSFSTLLDDPGVRFRDCAYSRYFGADAVISSSFSYTSYDGGKSKMLYDLAKDPDENENVISRPEYAEDLRKMATLLAQRQFEADQFGR